MDTIVIYAHGESRGDPGPAAVGVQIFDESGTMVRELSEQIGNATNEYAEYFSVIRSLQLVQEIFPKETTQMNIKLHISGELTKKQLNREVPITHPGLVSLFIEVHNLRVVSFPRLTFTHVRRELNKEAHRLVKEVLDA
jgi:ribonuclease HI